MGTLANVLLRGGGCAGAVASGRQCRAAKGLRG